MSTKMLENLTEVKEQSFKNNISKYYIMLVVEKKKNHQDIQYLVFSIQTHIMFMKQ